MVGENTDGGCIQTDEAGELNTTDGDCAQTTGEGCVQKTPPNWALAFDANGIAANKKIRIRIEVRAPEKGR
jgi:hypothetical protein